MELKEISSLQHPLVKHACELRCERKTREAAGQVLISGKKTIGDLGSTSPIDTLFFYGSPPNLSARQMICVTEGILKKIAGLEQPDGWAAIVALPAPTALFDKKYILILDQVSDPGNLGTLWRTALGLGWEGIWLLKGSVDPFNDKALRAAKGASFKLPYEWVDPKQIGDWKCARKATIFAADMNGKALDQCSLKLPRALVLGNEGHGLSPWVETIAEKVTIPIASIESLNVASAGAILLYGMRPRP